MSAPTRPIEALVRGLRILETLSRADGSMGNGQLARSTGLAPSTVSRLTDSLVQLGYLKISPESGAYYLTPKNLRLGYPVLANMPVAGRAQRVLDDLSTGTGVTSALAVRDELHVAFVATARGRNLRAVNLAVGGRLPVSLSAAGVALVTAMAEPHKSRLLTALRNDLTQRGYQTAEFEERLSAAERDPMVVSRGAWQSEIGGIAIAFRSAGQLYSLTLVLRSSDIDDESLASTYLPQLREAAGLLSD